MKIFRSILIIPTLFIFLYSYSAVQTYTFSESCVVSSWLVLNSGNTSCDFESFHFLDEEFLITVATKSIITDTDNYVTEGNRYVLLGYQFAGMGFNPEIDEGSWVNEDLDFGEYSLIESWTHEEGVEWPSDALYYFQDESPYVALRFQINGNTHYGWLKYFYGDNGFGEGVVEIEELAIESIPNYPIQVSSTLSVLNGNNIISGTAFVDENGNGNLDGNESPIASSSFNLSNSAVNFNEYIVSSPYSLSLIDGSYNLIINYNTNLWSPTTSIDTSFAVNASNPLLTDVNFGFSQVGMVTSVQGFTSPQTARCNEVRLHNLSVLNTGNSLHSGYLSYEIDDLCSFSSSSFADSIVGNTAYISWTNLGYGANFNFPLSIQMPSTNFQGSEINFFLKLHDSDGNVIDEVDLLQIVTCAYDPNDKKEFNGYTENGFINPGDELEYLIRFQNTGNDTANNIFLLDQLSPKLNWASFEAKAASHPYEAFIEDDGRLYIGFDNIFLPDSTTNEEESHGYFHFTILSDENLSPGTTIDNTVEIYFDFNPPIFTNTTINTIFDCENLAFFETSDSVCLGNELSVESTQEFIESYQWVFNGQVVGDSNIVSFLPEEIGDYYLRLTVQNPLCEVSDSILISIVEAPFVYAGSDISVCSSTALISDAFFTGNGSWTGPPEISFNDNQSLNPWVSASEFGEYELYLTVSMGNCQVVDTIHVSFAEPPFVMMGNPITSCGLTTQITDANFGGNGWWSSSPSIIFNDNSIANPIISASTFGTFMLYLSASSGSCEAIDSIEVSFIQLPYVFAGSDTSFCGVEGFLDATGMTNGIWSGPAEIEFADETDPNSEIYTSSQGSFECIWTETAGLCSALDTVIVNFIEIPWVEIVQNGGTLIANTFGNNYQWYLEGELIVGANEESYIPLESGNYTVSVEGQNNCVGVSDSFSFVYVGIDDIKNPSFTISPNPFRDFTVIKLHGMVSNEYKLELLDHSGRLIRTHAIDRPEIRMLKNLLPDGIYHLNLLNTSNEILQSEKLIIQ